MLEPIVRTWLRPPNQLALRRKCYFSHTANSVAKGGEKSRDVIFKTVYRGHAGAHAGVRKLALLAKVFAGGHGGQAALLGWCESRHSGKPAMICANMHT